MNTSTINSLIFVSLLSFSLSAQSAQTQLDVSGSIDFNIGFAPGNFSASFIYDDDVAVASSVDVSDPNDVGYSFTGVPHSGSANISGTDFSYSGSVVGIGNDLTITAQDTIDSSGYLPTGTFDGFALATGSPGTIVGGFDLFNSMDGILFAVVFLTDNSYLSDANTIPSPPSLLDSDAVFFVFLDLVSGSVNRAVIGDIDSFTVTTTAPVPLPAAFWLFMTGLVGLLGFHRNNK